MKKFLLALLVSISFLGAAKAQPCVGSETLTASPPPSANGTYYPGTVVTFCYSVTDYAQPNADWLCGAVPTLGAGWDLSTLAPVSTPASCDGQGVWGWYTTCTSTGSGLTFGPGFYYDSPAGSPNAALDGIPGNNFGDNCMQYTWTFCFSVMVAANAPNGTDLTVTMTAYDDYSVGSWGNDACDDPPNAANTLPATVINCTLIVPSVTTTNASCANTGDGSITVTPSGVAPYSFLWNTGATTATLNNLTPGIYTVTVTDSTLCFKIITIPVGGPQPITMNEVIVPDGCSTSGGSITLAPSGGTGSTFTYLWNNGTTLSTLTNLTGGTYIVTVTDSLNCTQTDTFTVITAIPIILSASSTSTGCTGANGSGTVVATGGTPPFNYNWSPSGGNSATAINLLAGLYTVDVSDSVGCTASIQVIVQAVGTFTLTTQYVPLSCDPAGTTTADVQINGGTAPFTYLWSPFGGNQQTGTGLIAGTYIIYVTDSNNCVDSATVVIPGVIPVTASAVSTPVQCNLPGSGTASVTGTGGTGSYTYLWSDGSTGSTAVNLVGGPFTVTVTDSQGCTATATITVNVIPDVFADAGAGQSVCSGQNTVINGSASGGTGPYNYSWDTGATGATLTVNPTSTTSYTLTVSDANNCTASSTVTITVVDYPVISISPDTDICYGAGTSLAASGGNTYSWSPLNGLNDPNISNPTASPQATTTYVVTVSNSSCTSADSVTVTVAPEILAGFAPDTTQGEAPLSVNFISSTTGASSYSWNFGDGTTDTGQSPTHVYTQQGSYVVTLVATNALGCSDTARYSFIVVDELASLTVPNVFTPNNDGYNDAFEFIEKGISSISVLIFNRWGKEIYSWNKANGAWDGKSKDGEELPDGVYLYVITARGIDDKSYDSQGTVHLIRSIK